MFELPLGINWWRVGVYLALIGLFCFAEFKVYSAGENHVQTQWELVNAKVAESVAADKAVAASKLKDANDTIASQKIVSDAQLAQLTSKFGLTQTQAKKELQDAYSRINNYSDANRMLWQQTSGSEKGTCEVSSVSGGTPSSQPITGGDSASTIRALEFICAKETIIYNKCVTALDACYTQFDQPIIHVKEE